MSQEQMKLCKECRHFKWSNWCHAPQNGPSPIDGEPKAVFATASRVHDEQCGTSAEYWEPKAVAKTSPWWKFW